MPRSPSFHRQLSLGLAQHGPLPAPRTGLPDALFPRNACRQREERAHDGFSGYITIRISMQMQLIWFSKRGQYNRSIHTLVSKPPCSNAAGKFCLMGIFPQVSASSDDRSQPQADIGSVGQMRDKRTLLSITLEQQRSACARMLHDQFSSAGCRQVGIEVLF